LVCVLPAAVAEPVADAPAQAVAAPLAVAALAAPEQMAARGAAALTQVGGLLAGAVAAEPVAEPQAAQASVAHADAPVALAAQQLGGPVSRRLDWPLCAPRS